MMASPFTFYRGAALIMASDLARTENSGLTTQLCGDARLANFGLFGTPERRMVFDINDFDETHPGPFEWDVKRLVTSFEIAGRHRSFSAAQRRDASLTVTRAYREHMAKAARAPVLDVWYDNVDADKLMAWIAAEQKDELVRKRQVKAAGRTISKAMSRTNVQAFSRLVGEVDGELRIRSDPPLIVPLEDIAGTPASKEGQQRAMQQLLSGYQTTIASGRRPLDEFRYRHMARKVVGVGSVGTRAWIVLLSGRDNHDPLILQAKEAQASVLERFLEPSEYQNHAERVVRGQRLMQAASDMFLGWQRVTGFDGALRDFYIRQLHDWKGAVDLETIRFPGTLLYARLCGETLARAHARAGNRVASPPTWEPAIGSTGQWPTSRWPTPTRTRAITGDSSTPSTTVDCRRSKGREIWLAPVGPTGTRPKAPPGRRQTPREVSSETPATRS